MHPAQFIVLALAAGAVAVPQVMIDDTMPVMIDDTMPVMTMPPWFVYCHSAPPSFRSS
jgi:hypothetical protein